MRTEPDNGAFISIYRCLQNLHQHEERQREREQKTHTMEKYAQRNVGANNGGWQQPTSIFQLTIYIWCMHGNQAKLIAKPTKICNCLIVVNK